MEITVRRQIQMWRSQYRDRYRYGDHSTETNIDMEITVQRQI